MAFDTRRTVVERGPSTGESLRRVAALIFAIIQGLIGLRILLLLLDARRDNALVRFIVDLSQVFVAPFEGVLRQNVINLGGPQLDVAAVLALIGWTILEWIVLAFLAIFRADHHTETIRTRSGLPEPGTGTTEVTQTEVRSEAPSYRPGPIGPNAPGTYERTTYEQTGPPNPPPEA